MGMQIRRAIPVGRPVHRPELEGEVAALDAAGWQVRVATTVLPSRENAVMLATAMAYWLTFRGWHYLRCPVYLASRATAALPAGEWLTLGNRLCLAPARSVRHGVARATRRT